ncbi:glycoside hydrolase family 15 protein [Leifsonia sp. C5G2]|nr:glycoside hydrolase family 15 protein [Leifsonia sp. C5G2]
MVSVTGSVDWLCLPRFDSAACFAAMLDDEDAGRWRIAPRGAGRCTRRRYRGDTLILETEWETAHGEVRVTDFMPVRDSAADLVRIVEGLSGSVPMEMDLALRFDYGHVVPWVTATPEGIHAVAGPDAVLLTSDIGVRGEDLRTRSEFTVAAGERVALVLTWYPSHEPQPTPADAWEALQETELFWSRWSDRSTAYGPYRDAIQRSLITLKGLTYLPTGGVVAAPTTSLPEQPGGPRNWDYRFCWLRDATLALQSLIAAGYTEEARAWRDWLLRSVAGDPAQLQIMYGLDGRRRMPEESLDWLAGFDGATPVRVGNAAADQLQLDVWGELLDGLALTRSTIGAGDDAWAVQCALLEHLETIWDQPDNGLWEMRGPRRHFTHSKLMCWVAVDRMIQGAQQFGLPGPLRSWERLRARIRRDILDNGFDPELNSFVQSYGSKQLDASLLLVPRVGFLPPDDPRVIGTIEAIQRDLTEGGFVLRYRPDDSDDGLPGTEGVFLACSFWLVDALVGAGRRDDAEELFTRLLALRNDVGLLSEEWDVHGSRQLGNMPQAYSHFALIRSAFHLLSGVASTTEDRIELPTQKE